MRTSSFRFGPFLLVCCLAILLPRTSQAALTINNYDADRHDRFHNDPAFVGTGFDWSGVARNGLGSGLWGTLISPSFMLTATHFSVGGEVTFYESNDPGGSTLLRNVISSTPLQQDGEANNSDLTLVQLDAPVNTIDYFPIISNPKVGDELFVFGLSNDVSDGVQANVRVGRNEITGFAPSFSHPNLGNSIGDVVFYDYDTVNGVGDDEAWVGSGDSGGPSFVIVDGKPALVGIHWFRYTPDAMNPLGGTGDTLVSSFVDEINTAIAATGSSETVSSVMSIPEPSSLALFVMASGSCLWIRRRNRSA